MWTNSDPKTTAGLPSANSLDGVTMESNQFLKLARCLIVYLFVGFFLVGIWAGMEHTKCPDSIHPTPGEVMVGAVSWLPMMAGYAITDRGPSSHEEACK